jgi:uncharacterized protein (DUF58 family)
MALVYKKFIDKSTVAKVSALELKARQAVEGIIPGLHKSPYHGISVEFAEYREYTPGDEIKHIDWRVFSRSDKYFIKQYEEETNMRCYFLLDTSESMLYRSGKVTKLEYGSFLIAALAFLVLMQRDSVSLVTFDSILRKYIPPRNSFKHYQVLLQTLESASPGVKTDIPGVFHDLAERMKKRGLVIVISDFFTDVDKLLVSLQHFKHKKHEVIVFHVLDRAEAEFPFNDMTRFEGLEKEPDITAEGWTVRKGYLDAFTSFSEKLRKGCRQKKIDYVRLLTDEKLEDVLSKYLAHRVGRK